MMESLINDVYFHNNLLKKLISKLNEDYLSKEWEETRDNCEHVKHKLQLLRQKLEDEQLKKLFYLKLKKRRKKLQNAKKKRIQRAQNKQALMQKKKEENNRIDNWIKENRAKIGKEVEETKLRKEADLILEEVKLKRSESKKYLEILQELRNLRKVMVGIAKSRGEIVASEAETVFENVMDKLLQPWVVLDKEYALEEKGLKLMIKENLQEYASRSSKNAYNDWMVALFQDQKLTNRLKKMDINTFKQIRSSWDRYLSPEEGSEIPIGWVVPCRASSAAWNKLLQKKY